MADDDEGIQDKPRKRRRETDDEDEDERPRPRRRERDDDRDIRRRDSGDGGVGYVIPYKNGAALAAYYVGVFGMILCVLPPLSVFSGGTALVLGFLGMSRAKQNPEAHGRGHAIAGIILGAVQILTPCGLVGAFFAMGMLGSRH